MRNTFPWRYAGLAAAFASLVTVSGCSTLVGAGGPPADIYDLSASGGGAEGRRIRAQLLVPPPAAVAALATDRIAVRPEPSRIAYYPGAVWSDQLPALVQLKLVRAFENATGTGAVGRPGDSLAIDYQVIVDLRSFEIDVGRGVARVVFGVKLLDDRNGRVRAARLVEAETPSSAASAEDAVAALDAAADRAIAELVAWTAATL